MIIKFPLRGELLYALLSRAKYANLSLLDGIDPDDVPAVTMCTTLRSLTLPLHSGVANEMIEFLLKALPSLKVVTTGNVIFRKH